MAVHFVSKTTVSGTSAGRSTATEDGGMARDYRELTEVVTETDGQPFKDAYYFVLAAKADIFIENLNKEE